MEQKVGSAFIEIEAKLDKLEGRLTTEIQSIAQKSWQGFTSSFSQALWPLKWAIASVVSVWAFAALSKGIVTLADNLEQAKIAFTTMLWSEEKAVAMLQDLSDFAAKTPFELPEVRQNAKQLLAMGVSAENIIPTLKALGDAAAGTGADMTRLAMNYGQVITQGHLTGRELRDFLVNGIPLLDELAKNAGKSKEEIQNMISSGQISANDVTKAFETMTSEGGKFENLMYKQSATFTGLWSNFQDQLSQMGERIGGWLLDTLKDYVREASELIDQNENNIVESFWAIYRSIESIIDPITEVIGEIGDWWDGLFNMIGDWLSDLNDESETTTSGLASNWSDLFYYLELWIGVVSEWFKTGWNFIKETIWTVVSTGYKTWETLVTAFQWCVSWISNFFWKLKTDVENIFIGMVNGILSSINWLWDKLNFVLPKKLEVWKFSLLSSKSTEEYKNNLKSTFDTTKKLRSDTKKTAAEWWNNMVQVGMKWQEWFINKLTDIYSKRVNELANQTKKEAKELNTAFTYWDSKTGGWGGGWSSKQSKAQKEALKEIKEAYHDIEKEINTHNKAIEDAQKKVESLNKKYDELKEKARDAFHEARNAVKELDGQMEELGKDNTKSMIENYQKQQDKLKEMERKNKRIGDIAKLKSLEDWRKYDDEKWDINTKTKEIIEYLETQEEIAFLTKHLSSEQLKQAESLSRMTEAEKDYQKYLEKRGELEYKKAAALEKQAIAEAFSKQWEILNSEDIKVFSTEVEGQLKARYQDETGKMVEIVDFKNIQYAQDLFNKSEAIRLEKEALEKKIADEKLANEELTMEKIRLDQYYTNVHAQEINKQKSKVDELIQKYRELARAKSWAGGRWARAFGWEVKAWLPYLIWENFKPELFVPSTSGSVVPVNNYNQSKSYHFSGITINTNHAEDFWSEIQNHIGDYT